MSGRTSPFLRFFAAALTLLSCSAAATEAENLELFMDTKTKQIFAEAGPGRVRLGTFTPVEDERIAPPEKKEVVAPASGGQTPWYERLKLSGYTQVRYHELLESEGDGEWYHPADRTVADDTTLLIRRARITVSGDVTDNLFLYFQPDFSASLSSGDYSTQLRDAYGDLSFDEDKEFRLRMGLSKVPFGYTNLQSSKNRGPLERPEALNSAVEGERDLGFFLMWAPKEKRTLFKKLATDRLKGSGDYGVAAIGAYTGQGLNRSDQNDDLHVAARLAYPMELGGGQIVEPFASGYVGQYVPRGSEIEINDGVVTPTFREEGINDRRASVGFVLYPMPFGIETEWTIGEGPRLSEDYTTVEEGGLEGGYIQASYLLDIGKGYLTPFSRWQYYKGGRKFASNAPDVNLNEWDFGVEWQPISNVEFVLQYSYTNERTNSSRFPYEQLTDGQRIGAQVQFSY